MSDRAEHARLADTPWRGSRMSVRAGASENARRQREALARMSETEFLTGMSVSELDRFHAEQRARVFARYGVGL